jgi:hypothetical protein
MGAGAMIGPSSVLTCVEISDPTALGEKIAASLGGDDQSSYAECPEYGSCEVHYAASAHNDLERRPRPVQSPGLIVRTNGRGLPDTRDRRRIDAPG